MGQAELFFEVFAGPILKCICHDVVLHMSHSLLEIDHWPLDSNVEGRGGNVGASQHMPNLVWSYDVPRRGHPQYSNGQCHMQ